MLEKRLQIVMEEQEATMKNLQEKLNKLKGTEGLMEDEERERITACVSAGDCE